MQQATQERPQRKTIWVPIRSRARGVTGYLEMFESRVNPGRRFTIPGVSRAIRGPALDESKARLIED